MATKSERFRSQMERSGTPKQPTLDDGSRPAKQHNLGDRAGRKASVAFEDPATGARTRKSSRKSANRSKPESALHITAIVKATSPSTRATRKR